jgi:hypothetical protein
MDIVEFERRLRALAKRDGLTFATFATLPPADRAVLVATIAQCFDAAAVYREREVNERLKTWLSAAGAMIETDHVHIRRWLVDTGVMVRTPDCAEYRLSAATAADRATVPDAIGALDAASIVAATRSEAREARSRRKAEWLARGPAADAGPASVGRK